MHSLQVYGFFSKFGTIYGKRAESTEEASPNKGVAV